jgi:hypothetical protein
MGDVRAEVLRRPVRDAEQVRRGVHVLPHECGDGPLGSDDVAEGGVAGEGVAVGVDVGHGDAGIDTAAVRAWAASNGIELSARGRLPKGVVQQYRDAGN